jgi:hypothetical protein
MKTNLADAKPADGPASEPSPADDSVQLTELFVEAARLATDAELRDGLETAGKLAKQLSGELAAGAASQQRSRVLIERLSQSCTACHQQRRN